MVSLKKIIIYGAAFILGLFCINLGFYVVTVYHYVPRQPLLGPLSIFVAYFVFGVPPVVLYFRWVIKDRWTHALLKGLAMVLLNVMAMAGFAFIIMRATGKV